MHTQIHTHTCARAMLILQRQGSSKCASDATVSNIPAGCCSLCTQDYLNGGFQPITESRCRTRGYYYRPTLCKCTLLSKSEQDEDGEVSETDETKAAGGHHKAAPSFPLKPAHTRRSTCREGRYKTLKTKSCNFGCLFFTPQQNFSADNCKMSHRFTGLAFIHI